MRLALIPGLGIREVGTLNGVISVSTVLFLRENTVYKTYVKRLFQIHLVSKFILFSESEPHTNHKFNSDMNIPIKLLLAV